VTAGDPRFFERRGPFRLSELAALGGGELADAADGDRLVRGVAALETAGPDDVSFLDNKAYLDAFERTMAGACVVSPRHAARARPGVALLLSAKPYRTFALIAQAFHPPPAVAAGVHRAACVAPDARLGEGVEVGPHAVIGGGAEIGEGASIGPNAVVGPGVRIGPGSRLHACVVVTHALVGARVTLHAGVKIGQDGFGFAPDPTGHVKAPQLGRVLIGDDCEIGANTTIDRGHLHDTVIGEGVWIDNLVQIGHNVRVGRGSILVAQSGISGSTKLGDFVALGGQAGITGHLTIGAGAQIAAQSGVMADVPPGAVVCGSPAAPIKEFFRQVATLKRLSAQRRDAGDE
jgi:UDP-3-O-[3-hydroxymyristoyl] glucosamine N-acyltransferase